MLRSNLIFLLALCLTPNSYAADKDGKFSIKGAGVSQCRQFLAEQKEPSARFFAYGGWVDGYLTAANEGLPETFDLAPWQSLDLLAVALAEYCEQRPDASFLSAVREVFQSLIPQRLTDQSQMIDVKLGDVNGKMYREVLRRAQEVLKKRGHYQSSVDGLYGPRTQAAFEAFQREVGLDKRIAEQGGALGLPDQVTLWYLFREDKRYAW